MMKKILIAMLGIFLILACLSSVMAVSEWLPGTTYQVADQVSYNGKTYQCLQSHTSLIGWEPPNVPALWKEIATASPTGIMTPTPTRTTTPTPTRAATVTPIPTPASVNLALNKTVTVSSTENTSYPANYAVDGNTGTRWASAYSDPQWISVDLGAIYQISQVKLNWEAAYASSYSIQTSTNGTGWTTVWSTTNGAGGVVTINFATTNARYVRMYGTVRGTAWGYSLWEFEVYGSGSATPTPTIVMTATPTPTATSTPTPTAINGINKPFPQNISFSGCIKPNNVTQTDMNNTIKSYYDYWKNRYVKASNGNTPGGGYYVEMKGTGGDGSEKTTSEAHGYGMIIFALMAGYDSQAKQFFDGMYNMYNKHRSTGNSHLMSWVIHNTELTQYDQGSATDGDMDIAYALLLAHYQWGSNGTINYLEEAKRIITNGLKMSDMSRSTYRTLLGDWSVNQYNTRASDWMTGHFRCYYAATNDGFWLNAADTVYNIISQITNNYAPNTGLMPDFIVGDPARPAPPNFLEADTDDDYSWNSCRFPWRIAMDYAHFGIPSAKNVCMKMLTWLKNRTGGNPANIVAGYMLNGTELVSYSDAAFTAPFMAASIVDSSNQNYLNQGWSILRNWKTSYYGDSINLLCMLFISGNWWAPR